MAASWTPQYITPRVSCNGLVGSDLDRSTLAAAMGGVSPTNMIATSQKPTGKCTILLFAAASEYCGNTQSLEMDTPTTMQDVVAELEKKYPGITKKILRSCMVTVNLEYVDYELDADWASKRIDIKAKDEIGIIPPVSAG